MFMKPMLYQIVLIIAGSALCVRADGGPSAKTAGRHEIPLTVKAGVPLRVAIEEKTPIRVGEPVRGTLVHPVYVFDREVVPEGTAALGHVEQVEGVSKKARTKTYLRGRFRTKRKALVAFDTLVLEDGRRIPMETSVSLGTPAMVRLSASREKAKGDPKKKDKGVVGSTKSRVKQAVTNHELVRAFRSKDSSETDAQAKTRTQRAKNAAGGKWRSFKGAALSYWPFGKQNLRPGTEFTAVLNEPLDFGTGHTSLGKLERLGSAPPPDTIVRARLVETVSSETASLGSAVDALITRPVFSAEGDLILPEGARLKGEVTQVKPARRFGRNGKLRFRFTKIEMPSGVTQLVSGSIEAAEVDSRSRMRLDSEGGAKVAPSKKRFIAPAVAVAVAMTGVPDDEDGVPTGPTAQGAAPGWSGFGILGSVLALSTRAAAAPLGLYGAGSSIYFNLVRRADELVFPENTLLEIRFGRIPDESESQPLVPQTENPQDQPAKESKEKVLRSR